MSFAFCKVLSCLLLRHDTVDKKCCLKSTYSFLISFKPARKTHVTCLCNEMSLFCYIARYFSYRRHSVSFKLQLIWGNAIFASVVARVFTLSFVPRIVLTKLKTTTWFLLSNLTTLALWQKYRFWEPWMTLPHLNNSIVCFRCDWLFLRCLQRSRAQQQKFWTCEKSNVSLNKKMHSNFE